MSTALSPVALDALRELTSIGSGNAATALSKMVGGRRVLFEAPEAEVVPSEEVARRMEQGAQVVVRLGLAGDVAGEFLVSQTEDDARRLGTALYGSADLGDEVVRSALCEVGNVVASIWSTVLERVAGLKAIPSVPEFAREGAPTLIGRAVLRTLAGGASVVLRTRLVAEGFAADLVMLPASADVPYLVDTLLGTATPAA